MKKTRPSKVVIGLVVVSILLIGAVGVLLYLLVHKDAQPQSTESTTNNYSCPTASKNYSDELSKSVGKDIANSVDPSEASGGFSDPGAQSCN